MVMPGLINLDFADVRSVMAEMGKAMMGTGEGSGENRALEAAEKAIANPLLDGVSMQGAKGVIISIIGGEDMKLLEVDEAANHIRELVDPQANIIWGSAFNPDLDGKIRVSVVATGIEQGAISAEEAPRPLNLGLSRGPAIPSAAPAAPAAPMAVPAVSPLFNRTPAPAPEPVVEPEPEPEAEPEPAPFASFQPAAAEPEDEPVEESVVDSWDEDEAEEDVRSDAYASLTGAQGAAEEPLDLQLDQAEEDEGLGEGSGDDELLLDATRLADDDGPVTPLIPGRRRGFLSSGNEPEAPAQRSGGGSTLFERMANLSRGAKSSDDKDEGEGEGEDSSAINIPRFLGRQNNQ
jgi:cell division protein FtsZ